MIFFFLIMNQSNLTHQFSCWVGGKAIYGPTEEPTYFVTGQKVGVHDVNPK